MSTCFWCTSGANSTADFLKLYASSTKPSEFQRVSDDLCYCLECVAIYHKARDEVPFLHEALWELETSRLISHFESTMQAEIKEESDLYIVENAVELPLFDLTYQDIENKLRVPLLEILKYPYLLLHERVSELCVEALCRLEQASCSFQVFEKYPGVYLFLVHPNEMVRRWAILTAKSLGKVDRDDYYDLQEVLTCLFKVMKLGLLESPDIYNSSVLEKGKLILLPAHMYDTMNYKTYWLGICMLLTILEEQAMDSLLLGSGKENDFMQSILHTMKKQSDGNFSVDINPFVGDAKINDSGDPFWPALHCFMVILDRLGSKVWGQRVDPIEAFQTIIDNNSYNREIQNIRKSSVRTKVEPESCLDDMVTCSQIVYSYNPEKNKKDSGWRSAICPDYCPNMYEEMETLTSVLQSDIGQDMRVHNSTFLWFIPFVQSLMDLQDLGVAYIAEVIHHLYSKVKDVLNQTVVVCDKVTEFFLLILVSVIELHRNRKCLHFLWASSQSWVEAVVKCAKLPTSAFAWSSEKSCSSGSKGTLVVPSVSLHSMPSNSVQHACVQLIRSLLKEGYQLGQPTPCKRFWDKLNLFLRGNLSLGWQLTSQETQELQTCLKQIIKNIKAPQCNTFVDPTLCKPSPACYYKEEREKEEKCKNRHCLPSPNPAFSKEPKKADVQGSVSSKARSTVKEGNEQNSVSDSKLEDHLSPELCFKQSSKNLFNEGPQDQVTSCSGKQKCVNDNLSSALQSCTSRNSSERECDRGIGGMVSPCLLTDLSTDSLEKVSTSNEDFSLNNDILGKTSKARSKAQKDEICAKLSRVIKKQHSKSTSADNIVKSEGNLTASDVKNLYSRKATGDQKGEAFLHSLSVDSNSILDNKNGEQKSDNRSLLTKKQLKNEELDVFSAHENDCHIQECHTVTDVASFTDVTNTCMHKTSPFRDPVSGLESRTKEVAKRIRWLSLNLRVENLREVSPKSDPLKDSQIDTDLNKLPLVAQGSTSTFPSESAQNTSQLQRKVKDKRSLTANRNNAGETHCGQIIVISDSDDDDDDERVLHFEKHIIKQDKICIEKEGPQHHVSVGRRLMEKEKANSPLLIEEDDSQVFEFESQKNVFSVWQEQKPDSKNSVQGDEETACLTDMADITNDWGYDTDYPISEEVSAKGAEDIEERARPQNRRVSAERVGGTEVKKPKRKQSEKPKAEAFPSRPSTSDRDEDQSDIFNESELTGNDFKVIDLTTTAAGSGIPRTSTVPLKKSSPKLHTYSKTIRRVSASKTPKKTQSDTKIRRDRKASYLSCRTTPAIVPPKKFRQCPEPASKAEKLGLKKGPRKAFELSQRSLAFIDQLRHHGQTAGDVDTGKKTRQISQPPSVRSKLLKSQDFQLQRQLRSKSQRNRQGLADECRATAGAGPRAVPSTAMSVSESGRSGSSKGGAEVITHSNGKQLPKRVSFEQEPKKGNYDPQVTGSPCVLNQRSSVVSNGRTPTNEITPSTSEDLSGGGHPTIHLEVAALQNGEPEPCGDMEEDDNVFLTQRDPEDMDLCSQMQNEDDKLIEVAHEQGTVQVEDSLSRPQLGSLGGSKCKYKDCAGTVKSQGEYCSRHSDAKAADEDVFRKPALPLSAAKPLRPTTTKIFSSSTNSRIANLSRSLENTPAPAPATKNKTSGVQSILKVSPPACAVSQKPMAEVKSLCNVLHSPAPITSNRQGYKLQLGDSKPSSVFQVSILLSSQSILETFIKEVLKWKYEMFVNFDQCGPPAGLCQSISRRVPLRFQDCGDYIDVFFPLVLLNTFEAVAQEWISSPNKGKLHQLRVRKFPTVYKKYWEFVVYLDECELAKQFHPRENDLVVLVSERLNGENDMERNALQESQAYHCGYVHKFRRTSVMHNGKSECSLCIQSQENLPVKLNDLVKCIVISSLVTTQRKLKAMSLLSGRNQLARAILNPHPTDFSTKDLLTTSSERITAYLNSFNEDQRKAIETAYAMVKHSPSVAKICLIHGPPGTGKSKTIVGFLYRLLTENLRKGHSDENSNAKIKQNRVLVCAPSNAAIDELMKKIIVEFKERCKDKHNPQGNCGDINLVRLGAEKSISSEVLRFSLDSQVDHRMKKALPSHVQEMHKRKEYLDRQLDELSRQRALCRGRRFEIQKQELDEKIAQVSKERQELASKVKEVQGRPQKTQNTIILESHVICCTLSTSGGLLLECAFWGQGGVPFSCVIVDEAGQACEVETLTPLIHRCNKLILVGDPKQLPPTVISMKAQEYGYDQSMMARFYKLLEEDVEHNMSGRLPVVQLTMQYRMHPDICLFPSTYIYNKTLKTHRPTESCRCSSEWPFQPYLVFDVGDGSERRDNDSYINVQEIKLVMEIIKLIKERKKDVNFRNIGIITHYRAQKTMIQKELDKEFDGKGLAEVDTVDAFQGRQKDCVIVTCVRANSTQSGSQGSIGFLASLQRLNVTITRAKYSLFILGHLRTLMENQHWNHLIQDAQSRGAIIKTCDKNYKHDALKILKLRLALQRSVTYPPTTTPELPRSPGSLPGSRPDTDLARTFLTSSRCHAPSDSTEATITVAARDPERPLVIDQLRDPRLLRRLGVSLEATTRSLGDPQLSSPQDPGTTSSSGESGFSGSPQGLGSLMELSPATGSSHRPPGPCEPPAVSTDASTDTRQCDQEGEHRHQRDTKARSEGEGERWSKPRKRNSGRDSRDPDKEDSSSSKKRKLL